MSSRPCSSMAVFGLCLVSATAWASARGDVEDECTGGRPNCGQPQPAVITPHRLHAAVPAPLAQEFDDCSLPRATCVQPAAASVRPVHHSTPLSAGQSPLETLKWWEQRAATSVFVSERDFLWFSRMNEGTLSAHAIGAAFPLLGPVRSAKLNSDFEWSLVAPAHKLLVLQGIPRDATIRLFCPCIKVGLNRRSCSVIEMEIASRDGQWLAVKLPEPMWSDSADIQLAHFEAPSGDDSPSLPPSPALQQLVDEPADRPAVR